MGKNTKKTNSPRSFQIRVTLSNDHYQVLERMSEIVPSTISQLAGYAVGKGLPELQKRFLIDGETN